MLKQNLIKKVPLLLSTLFVIFGIQAFAQQAILSVTPNSSTPNKTIDVVIRGTQTNFSVGNTTASFGDGIDVLNVNVLNEETVVVSITIGAQSTIGFRTVSVKTGNSLVESFNGFEVFQGGGNFRASIEIMPFQSGSLSDLDVISPQSQPLFFFTTLYNDDVIRKARASVTLLNAANAKLFTIYTKWYDLTEQQVLRFNNQQYIDFSLHSPEGNYFLSEIKEKGTLPPGDYTFRLEVVDANGNKIGEDEGTTTISNPVYNPELISPGASFSNTVESLYSPYPLFQWFGQANSYDFSLYEVNPNQTPEEITRNIEVFNAKDIINTNLLYPVYAEKLIDQKVYGWQVRAKVIGTKGTQYLPSEVFLFRYQADNSSANSGVDKIQVSPQLYEIKVGEQFQFTAQMFDINGRPIADEKPVWKVVPAKGTITSDGLFTAGDQAGEVAIMAKIGDTSDFATVSIIKIGGWDAFEPSTIMDNWLQQLFGLPANN